VSNSESRPDKFETEDAPKIWRALKEGHERKETCSVTVQFADNGGVISVMLKAEKKFK
jgi:hypothetical protein